MVPSSHLLPGLDAGYSSTYVSNDGILRARTDWMKIVQVDHRTGVVEGIHKHTNEEVKVSLSLIHTVSSPYEHI